MKVTLAQLAPRSRAPEANLDRALGLIAQAGESDLLVLPELFLSGYQLANRITHLILLQN